MWEHGTYGNLPPESGEVNLSHLSNATFVAPDTEVYDASFRHINSAYRFLRQHNVLYCNQISTLYFKQPCYFQKLEPSLPEQNRFTFVLVIIQFQK